jgi:hypothetical protein
MVRGLVKRRSKIFSKPAQVEVEVYIYCLALMMGIQTVSSNVHVRYTVVFFDQMNN